MHDAAGIWVKNERPLVWSLRPFNHNLLRISRILRSLRLLGRGQKSIAPLEALDSVLGEVLGQEIMGENRPTISVMALPPHLRDQP